MKTITEIIKPITLLKGSHEDTGQTGQGCFMNVIAYLNGEAQITDRSECVCVTIKPIAIWLNDYLQDNERAQMITFIERAMGSATTDKIEISRRLALVVAFAQKMRDISIKYAKYAAQCDHYAAQSAAQYAKYAAVCDHYAAQSAAQYAKYAAECARFAAQSAARSAAEFAIPRQQIINAAFEYLDAALPKSDCIDSAVLKRAEKLAEML